MKRAMAGICLAAVLTAVACLSTGCDGTLYVSFDAGEYGVIAGVYTQAVPNLNDLAYPAVEAEAGYVFVGFRQTPEQTPKSGKVRMTAQYQQAEFRFVDGETGEYLEEGDRLMLPTWGPSANKAKLPQIETTVTDMQSGEEARDVFEITENGETYRLSSVRFAFLPGENEYVTYEGNLLSVKDFNSRDWESSVEVSIQCGGEIGELKQFETKRFHIGKNHTRISKIQLELKAVMIDGAMHTDGAARSGATVLFQGSVHFEDGEIHPIGANENLFIDRIWNNNGEIISPNNYHLYAYCLPYAANKFSVQLTDLAGDGWNVNVVVVNTYENTRSNVYTIEVF